MIILTIDTNLINARQHNSFMNTLEKRCAEGTVSLVGAAKLFQELNGVYAAGAEKAKTLISISEPFTIGYSRIGDAYLAAEEPTSSFNEIGKILFEDCSPEELNENQANDVMHLIAHLHSSSDYFITENTKDFIKGKKTNANRNLDLSNIKRDKLAALGIRVRTPEEIVKELGL